LLFADSQPDGENEMATDRLENIVGLAKRRGFVYPSSEIYGGLRA
jgi:glycyl-tRNA synthetase